MPDQLVHHRLVPGAGRALGLLVTIGIVACGGQATSTSQDAGGSSPRLLAGGAGATWLTVDGETVLWANGTKLEACAIGGCNGRPTDFWADASEILSVDAYGGAIYWSTTDGRMSECPSSGCTGKPANVVTGQPPISDVAIDASGLYWVSSMAGTVSTCTVAACASTVVVLASGQDGPTSVGVAGGRVYWTTRTSLMSCDPRACAAPTAVASNRDRPWDLGLDSGGIVWSEYGSGPIQSCSAGGCTGVVARCALSGCGGTPTLLAQGLNHPSGIVTDGTNAYWVTEDGHLWRTAVSGKQAQPSSLAEGQEFAIGRVLAVTGGDVVWTNVASGVFVSAK